MTKKRFRKILNKHLVLSMLVLVAGLFVILAKPAPAYAYVNTDKTWTEAQQHDRTQLAAIAKCFEKSGGLTSPVSGSDINQQAVWDTIVNSSGNSEEMPLGYEIDPDNGERQCQNLDYDGALSLLGMTWQSFWQSAYSGPDGGGNYTLKSGASAKLHQQILNKLKDNRDSSNSLVGSGEKDRRVLVGLTKCIQSIPNGKAPTNGKVDKPGYEKYEWQDGVDGGHTVDMGYDLTFYDSDNDGTYTCDTLVNLGKGVIGDLGKKGKTLEDATGTTGGSSVGSSNSDQLGCDFTSNPLSWVICPAVDTFVAAIQWTDKIITQQMVIPSQNIFCSGSNTCDAYYTAWSSFRNIALGLLAVAGLIVVIAQAIGMEILDAYTIRKMLPRILIASIGITLSWTLMNFAVTLSNNLGLGIRDLIVAPFNGLSSTINLNFSSSWIVNFFGGGAAGVFIGIPAWIAGGGIGVLLSYAATAGLAVLIAILVLVLRQIAVTLLILISPIALIAYVLPNTQRIFKLWWESFSRALLMFPLIAGFIAAGRVFSAIALTGAGNGVSGSFQGILGFIAYFAPYFMIPLTFSMSGAMMGGLGNMVNSRAQGVQGLLGNYRKGQAQSRIERARKEGLYRPGLGRLGTWRGKPRSVGNALNSIGFWGLNADEMIPMKLGTTTMMGMKPGKKGIPGFRRGGQALMSQIERAKRDQTVKAAQDLDIGYKSGRLMAGEYQYYTEGLTGAGQKKLNDNFRMKDGSYRAPENWGERQRLADIFSNDAITEGEINPLTGEKYTAGEGHKGNEAREAGGELRGVASEFEKYTASPETNRVDGRLLGLLSSAKAGRLEMNEVANNHNKWLRAGNQERAIRETTLIQDALTPKRVSAARGHSLWWDKNGNAHSSYEDPTSKKAQISLARINTQELAAGKSEDIDALEETLVAGASVYKVKYAMDKRTGKKRVMPIVDEKTGQRQLKDPRTDEGKRVKEVQNRMKTMAMYNSGDSDIGRKIRHIWTERLLLPESDLEWGSRTGDQIEREMAVGGVGQPPLDHPPADGPGGGGG